MGTIRMSSQRKKEFSFRNKIEGKGKEKVNSKQKVSMPSTNIMIWLKWCLAQNKPTQSSNN